MSTALQRIIQETYPDRTKYLGGSDVAAILGVSPWKSEFQTYQEKVGEYQEEITPAKQKIFNRGKRWEPIVIEMLVDELEDRGHDVQIIGKNNRYIDPEHDYLAAEIDLELVVDGRTINGEMKTVHPFAAKHWGEQGTDEIPLYYTAQVLHGQMVTNQTQTVVAALIGADDLRVHFVDRDDDMIAYIRMKEIEFWKRVLDRKPPEPVTTKDINRLYQIDAGSIMEADDQLLIWCNDVAIAKQELKDIEARIDSVSTYVKARMGLHSLLMHDGQKIASWKNNKPSIKTDWEKAYLDLKPDAGHIKNYQTIKTGARPFLITKQ